MKSREEFSERMEKIRKQRDSRPSNCKHCKLSVDEEKVEWICGRTERQTFFGARAEKCRGDCVDYEKGMGELCRDVFLSALKSAVAKRTVEPPKCDTMENLQSWMNGYAQCQRDILGIIDILLKEAR